MKIAKLWLLATAVMGIVGISLNHAVADIAPAGPAAASAEPEQDEDEPGSATQAVRSHIETLVHDATLAHLQAMGIREQGLTVEVQPDLDMLGKIAALRVKLTIVTDIDRQEQIGREVRQAVQRALIDDGYRFELPGVDTQALPVDILARPLANLTLQVEYPVETTQWYERLALRPILVLVAMLLLALMGLYICWLMTGRFWRSIFPETAKSQDQKTVAASRGAAAFPSDVGGLPPLPDSSQQQNPSLELAPPPPVHMPVAASAELLPNIPVPTSP